MMSSLTITLPDQRMEEFQQLAVRLGSSPEALLEESIEQLLQQADMDIRHAIQYVLSKNHDLYTRLA